MRSYFLAAQGFFAAHGFFAAQGLPFVAHGFFAAQGLALLAAQGFLVFWSDVLFLGPHGAQAAKLMGPERLRARAPARAAKRGLRHGILKAPMVHKGRCRGRDSWGRSRTPVLIALSQHRNRVIRPLDVEALHFLHGRNEYLAVAPLVTTEPLDSPIGSQHASELVLQLNALRPKLLKFARLQLRNDHAAEDVVQEAMLSAIEQAQHFAGRSSVSTWVTAILKNKIIDHLRKGRREVSLDVEDGSEELATFDALFDENGRFREPPRNWGDDPEAALSQRQFFAVLEVCVEALSAQAGRVFMMREWLELSTDEICQELGISPSNCWVLLYRARMRLRECLEANWFNRSH